MKLFGRTLSLLNAQSIFTSKSSSPKCNSDAAVTFSQSWQVLGPFQIGTREATWGADPLELYGGFPHLKYDPNAKYSSSLAANATITWSTAEASSLGCTSNRTKAVLNIGFSHIDWSFLQSIYGWAALQYQAWARGTLYVSGDSPQTILLYTERLLEFHVDGHRQFGGDYYGYEKVPLVLHLNPGHHTLHLRLVRDVRSMGGIGTPTIDVSVTAEVSAAQLVLSSNSALLPDMVNGRLASSLGSVTVRNHGLVDAYVTGVSINDTAYFTWLAQPSSVRLVPGQTRSIAFVISCQSDCSPYIRLDVEFAQLGPGPSVLSVSPLIKQRRLQDPHKITFLSPGGMVSYAILRAPVIEKECPTGPLPVILQLHGAGVDADNDIVRHALDPVSLCAWALYPTGSTAWSGDDWHTWGFSDVEAAVEALPIWLDLVNWQGPGVDINRWLVVGHSNGGQGTWYALTHRPDKVIAAAPISGYSSIQNYVPYDLWRPMDSSTRALLEASLGDYRHERLLSNAQHIPVLQQHGSVDDNVPAFHSRLMSQLIHQAGANSKYIELDGMNHWFDGVITTKPLTEFYKRHLNGVRSTVNPPSGFNFVVANPATMGSKHGILVLQLLRHGQLGKVDVSFSTSGPTCFVRTSNILSLSLPPIYTLTHEVVIDGQKIDLPSLNNGADLLLSVNGSWKTIVSGVSSATRHGRQLGSMDAFLRTSDGLHIARSSRSPAVDRIALQISRNLCQYFDADTSITDKTSSYTPDYSNVVRVAIGRDMPESIMTYFPISIANSDSIAVRGADGITKSYVSGAGLGAIFLRPLKGDQVELVVWGSDEEGLEIAARLVPMLTGVGQPDFVVVDQRMLWGGAGEVLAMGYFDHLWNVTAESYLT